MTGAPPLEIDAPATVPPLPAAIEVGAYRIACEALANVVRHARADRCRITLTVDDAVDLEIVDDGIGLPEVPRPGVGLVSMRERARELGGTLTIATSPLSGTSVHAVLPVAR